MAHFCRSWGGVLAAIAAVLLALSHLSAISSSLRKISGPKPDKLDLEALRPTLLVHKTSFGSVLATTVSTKLLFLQFSAASLLAAEPQVRAHRDTWRSSPEVYTID
jgi:hypothetical protein